MSTLNFPANPNPGDRYTIGDVTWEWDGYAWIKFSDPNKTANLFTATQIFVTTTTNAISTASGALQVAGGGSFGGDLWLGGTLYAQGVPVLTTASFVNSVSEGDDIRITDLGGGVLEFANTSTLQTVTGRGATTTNIVYFASEVESTSTNTGAVIISGGLGVGKRINCESLKIQDSVFDSTVVLVNTTATTVVDQYFVDQFRSAKYLIQIDEGAGAGADFQVIEILLLVDNVGTVFATEYGLLTSNGDMGEFAADVGVDDIVRLYFTPYFATNKSIKVLRTGMSSA